MDRLKEYKIAYRGLGEGVHSFEFVMDDNFFDCFDATKGTKGKVNARVEIVKSSLLMEVRMKIDGAVKAICDRCLEEMDLSISGELNLYATYGGREEGNDDDFIMAGEISFVKCKLHHFKKYDKLFTKSRTWERKNLYM